MKIQSSRIKLDKIDRKILDILQSNAKITNAQLSKDIGLSPAPTLERVKKLETSGIIKSYHAKLDTDKVGLGVHTFVQVSLKGHNKKNIDAFINEINSIPEVIECHHITGSGDFILKIISSDIQSYQKLMLEKVSEIEVVDGLQSMIILSTFKDSKVMPVPENE
ncbi:MULTISPECIES: Lrp/AsnC family transcriptional regulator [unclassified Ekhidna]|jgi:Lrp/AsnC family leucine-responsive transcriptional regulator|uniref:Lrp/AsnC family transcriptional regulator n=1 Tax=unclassified Ekhidna TaxID=2632188 RepID=UPI003297402C